MNWLLLYNTLIVATAATAVAAVIGFCAALWASGLEARWRGIVSGLAVVALVLPPFLVSNCWIDLLGQNGGLRRWLPLNIYSLGGTIWILALLTWPIAFFFVSAAWRRVEASQLEVDPLLRGFALVRWLLFPMCRPALIQAGILTFVLTLNNFTVPAILQVKVFPAEIWVGFNTTFDYVAALQLCWPMILAPLLVVTLFRRSEVVWGWRSETMPATAFRRQLGTGWLRAACLVTALGLTVSVGLPLFHLAGSANTWRELWPAFAAGQSAMIHSLGFAAATATVVIVFALVTWRFSLHSVLWIPFLVPGVLLGISLIWIFNRPGLSAIYQSVAIVIAAYFIRYAALGWNCVARAARGADRNLTDVARLEGASAWQMVRHVLWPQISSQVAAGWYVTYLLCLWDVETLVLIVPPGSESAAVRIFNLLHYGHNSQVNALCLLMLLLALLPLGAWFVWRKRNSGLGKFSFKWLLPLLLATGCSESQDHGRVAIKSQFFSDVEIIGSRGTGLGQFNKPRSVAVDTNDNLYVVDMTGRLQKFSPDGQFLSSYQFPQTDKGKPKGMCRDQAGNIVVIEPHYCRVNCFTPDLKLVAQWGVRGTNVGQLAFPRAVGVNSSNEVYVSEYSQTERVQRFVYDGSKCLGVFGRPGGGAGEFNRAEGLSIDFKNQVYVADSCNHRVQVFSAEGKLLKTYGKAGQGLGQMSYPLDVRVERSGLQFVCEFGNSRIQIFDSADRPLEILGQAGGNPGQFSNPWAICLDSKGNLYVADGMNHRVQKFTRKKIEHS